MDESATVMLKTDFRSFYLPGPGLPPELSHDLRDLGYAGGTDNMSLG